MNPFEVLGLPESATSDEVRARWRTLRSEHHPDNGGDGAKFDEFHKAFIEAISIASEPKVCDACGGAGTIQVSRGFNTIKVPCQICHGSGQS